LAYTLPPVDGAIRVLLSTHDGRRPARRSATILDAHEGIISEL
jgi:hypothetical protein